MNTWTRQVEEQILAHGMMPAGTLVLAAVSGGADSVALLLVLHELKDRLGFRLAVVHYEHGLRPKTSLEDARFVQDLSSRLNLDCLVEHGDVPALERLWKCGPEDAARRARYAFFERAMKALGAERVALAHHRRDQAETLLLHWVRGAGLKGLCGMRPVQGPYVRPFLTSAPEQLRDYLARKGQSWREDETNADLGQPRALLRHVALPALERINPAAVEILCRNAEGIARDEAHLEALAGAALEGKTRSMPYGGVARWAEGTDPALAGRMLRMLAARWGIPEPDWAQTLQMVGLAERPRGAINLFAGWRMEKHGKNVHFIMPDPPRWTEQAAGQRGVVTFEGLGRIRAVGIQEEADAACPGDGIGTQTADCARLEGCVWRTRRAGDRIHPFGASGGKLLSDYLTDRKIDRPFRDWVPLLARGDEILWAVGVGA
ncbi:MAG TPA: tRNA lysidine(34) synthetase TilS, partial [Clostridia bacterium]|nr:tRNA lysidine(34) synthetase TilS [Clostridia bacterium]